MLLVLLAFDILGCVVRIASRWYPQSTVATLFQLPRFIGLVIECWTYGLGHATVRTQLQKYLRRRRRREDAPSPGRRPPELPTIHQAWQEACIRSGDEHPSNLMRVCKPVAQPEGQMGQTILPLRRRSM